MARILLLDDEPQICRLMGDALEKEGHVVHAGRTGWEGLATLAKQAFDMLVTDIVMPDKDGYETIREVRAQDPDMPILAISGFGTRMGFDCLKLSRDFGANQVLHKPFTPSELVRTVNALL